MHGENLIALGKLRPRRLTPAHWRSLLQTNLTQSSDATPYHEIERCEGGQRDVSHDVVDETGLRHARLPRRMPGECTGFLGA